MSQRIFFKKSRDERDHTLASKRSFNEAEYESDIYDKLVEGPLTAASTAIAANGSTLSKATHATKSVVSTTSKPLVGSFAPDCNKTSSVPTTANHLKNGTSRSQQQPPAAGHRQLPNSSSKTLYQVVSNVKESDVVHQLGEKQAFKSDLQYYFDLLDPVVSSNTTLTRSLAAMNLTKKLVNESFESTFTAMDGLRTVLLKLTDSAQDASGCLPLAYAVFIWVLVVKYNRTLGRSIWNSLLQGCDAEEHAFPGTSLSAAELKVRKAIGAVSSSVAAISDHRKVVVRAKEIFICMKPYDQLRKGAVPEFIKLCDTKRGVLSADIFHDILLHIDISRHSVRSLEFLREEKSLDSLIALTASQIACLKDLLAALLHSPSNFLVDAFELDQYQTKLIRLLNIVERYLHVLATLCSEHEDASSHFITKSDSLMLDEIDWLLYTGVESCLGQSESPAPAGKHATGASTAVQPRKTRGAAKLPAFAAKDADEILIVRQRSPEVNFAVIRAWQGTLHEACNVIRAVVSCCDLWRTTVGDMPHCIPSIISCCLLIPSVLSDRRKPASAGSSQPNRPGVAEISTKAEGLDFDDDDIVEIVPKSMKIRKQNSNSRPSSSASGASSTSSSNTVSTFLPQPLANIKRYDEHHDYKLQGVAAVAMCNLCDGNAINRQKFLDYCRPGLVDDPVKAFVALLRRRCGDSLHHNQTLEEHRSELTEERLGRQADVSAESIFRAVNRALEHADAAVDSTAIATYVAYFFAYMVKDDTSLAERIVAAWNSERDAAATQRAAATATDSMEVDAGDVELNILHIFDIMERFEQFLLLTKLSSPDDIANMTEIRQHFKVLVEALS